MTARVSDVTITAKAIRRTVAAHGLCLQCRAGGAHREYRGERPERGVSPHGIV
jgi:hypothetical protein